MVAIITCFSPLLGIKSRNCSQPRRRGSRWQCGGPGRKPSLTRRGRRALRFFSSAHVFFSRGSSDILLTATAASISAKSVVRIVFGEGASLVTWVRNVKSTRSLKKNTTPTSGVEKWLLVWKWSRPDLPPWTTIFRRYPLLFIQPNSTFDVLCLRLKHGEQGTSLLHVSQWQ